MSIRPHRYKVILILTFIISFSIMFFVITNDKNKRIKEHLRQVILTNQMNYDVNLRMYKKLSQQTFDLIVEQPDVLNILQEAQSASETKRSLLREKLYDLTKEKYAKLVKLGVLQFQFVFPNNKDFLRVHKHGKFGDDLTGIRYSFNYVNKHKKPIEGFEGGRTTHAYRFVYPVFSNKSNYLGSVEISFSSGALQESMEKNHNTHTHFIVNKKLFNTNLWKPEIFQKYLPSVENENYLYTVTSNMDVSERENEKKIIDKFMKKDIEKNLKHEKSFALYQEFDNFVKVVTFIPVSHTDNKSVAAYLVSHTTSDDIAHLLNDFRNINVLLSVFLLVLFYFIYRILKSNTNIKIAQKETKSIINFLPSIMILNRNKNMIEVNLKFLMFFNQHKDIDDFLEHYECICDLFEEYDDENYIQETYVNKVYWTDYVKNNKDKIHKAMIIKDGKQHHFTVKVREVIYKNETTDIVQLIEITKELELNNSIKEKEKQLFQQAKMASMGEMIGNIAHQWRQPLNIISVMNMKVEFLLELNETINYDDYEPISKSIAGQLEYMTKTIDDFRSYYNPNKLKENFSIKQSIQDVYNLIYPQLNSHSVDLIITEDSDNEELIIYGHANEFKQVIINMVNNSKDAILHCQENDKDKAGKIEISIKKMNDEIIITIKDNGGGIPLDIIDKIYEPYFTTKHKSKGTGLGLNMSHQIITDHMNGTIVVYNLEHNKEDAGTIFIITLPINKNNNIS
ncbi:hypothetical protein HUE87_03835 [Candidatus Sulfurimonas marisnigri]|uniref:histidine kinase n=1 Tax=Candidatus Sulfurimonas marisnigri TaxID=2740405 RepID=A0A7S7RR80_9BACT|nr:ATP-binding protein [Candidatus Sulfurimonas marisnigri]QOY55378.1 hypothetical protein HUE87_03835 [Candidatus Sulfurimonas marisnigri]